ncbi:MAG: CAP domain-containing protein [Pseudomonadota bacterium]
MTQTELGAIFAVMLQIYDKPIFFTALAMAVLGTTAPANATSVPGEVVCTPETGYADSVTGFHAEAANCLALDLSDVEIQIADRTAMLTQRNRSAFNLAPLNARASLGYAARLHAMELAAREQASHTDSLDRSHLDRLRILDRRAVFGASGANIAVVPAGTSPEDAFNALIADPVNAENLTRDVFTHSAVGVAESTNGDVYVVQLFAQVDGELDAPAPIILNTPLSVSASLDNSGFHQSGWRLEAGDSTLRRASGEMVRAPIFGSGTGFIEIEAELGTATYRLKGPAIDYR